MNETQMRAATLIRGPARMLSDTYRLHLPGKDGKEGKMIDVPGWMVGDEHMAHERMMAAEIIRERLASGEEPERPVWKD